MNKKLVIIRKNPEISLSYDAGDWELYYTMEGAERVASLVNSAIVDAVNGGLSKKQTYEAAWKVMVENSNYGATDSEPYGHLHEILDLVFDDKNID